jgi:hypothetical protein
MDRNHRDHAGAWCVTRPSAAADVIDAGENVVSKPRKRCPGGLHDALKHYRETLKVALVHLDVTKESKRVIDAIQAVSVRPPQAFNSLPFRVDLVCTAGLVLKTIPVANEDLASRNANEPLLLKLF